MKWVIDDDGKTYFLERPKDGIRLEVEFVEDEHWKARLKVGLVGWPVVMNARTVLERDLPGRNREEAGTEAIGLIAVWMASLVNDLTGTPFGDYHP